MRREVANVETSPPPYALRPILPSTFRDRYNDDSESAILRSTFPGHRIDDTPGIRKHLFYRAPVVFPAYDPLTETSDENSTGSDMIATFLAL